MDYFVFFDDNGIVSAQHFIKEALDDVDRCFVSDVDVGGVEHRDTGNVAKAVGVTGGLKFGDDVDTIFESLDVYKRQVKYRLF